MSTEFHVNPDMIVQLYNEISKHFSSQRVRRLAEHLRKNDLSLNQFSVLNIVNHESECSSIHLANMLKLKAASITYIIDLLVKRGLVDRVENPEDRRSHFINLTEEGRKLLVVPEDTADLIQSFEALEQDDLDMLYLSLRVLKNRIIRNDKK
ncbi:MarR family winged helix-turn-helix transcriptional regulator [Cohnella sp. AR92]|uniref:MarR family winged helix-turn-helix transcriptional regulator n=1 Tax=Cohnella sp. AR92 TaxID=648716 RepID=UPI000F8E94DA|nr:MarR family transcriptional regulator [Cohnella sp. AR92]RUS47285.1 MarR family transcriptional regulator [Cohnella sp. AR92]